MQSIRNVLFYIILGAISVFVCYTVYKQTDIHSFSEMLRKVNGISIVILLILSFAAYWFRVLRWNILLRKQDLHFTNAELYAIQSTSYLLSFAIPRMGDVYRIAVCKRLQKSNFKALISVVLFERVSDVIMLVLFLGIGWGIDSFFQYNIIQPLLHDSLPSSYWIYVLIVALIAIGFIWKKALRIREFIQSEWTKLWPRDSMFSYLMYSFLIWFIYILLTYLWFVFIPMDKPILFSQGWLVMLTGSIARSLPLQAGSAGVYHVSVAYVLKQFGQSPQMAINLALLIHGFQTLFTLLSGLISYIWLLIYRPNAIQKNS